MKRIIRIEFLKIKSNASFWVLMTLHIAIILLVLLSGKLFIGSITGDLNISNKMIDPASIPLYQFPDIWHNATYVAAYLKFILAIFVIISITNEITFNTIRQNIMNGLGIRDFIASKMFLIVLLAATSTLLVFLTSFITGLVSTPDLEMHDLIKYSGFVPAYFLLLTAYLLFALLIGLLIKRAGIAIGFLFLYTLIIEPLVVYRIKIEWIKDLFPLRSINNLIHMPFGKYILREIQDYVALGDILVVIAYMALFVFCIYTILRKRDL
jgi:hypothetical protein